MVVVLEVDYPRRKPVINKVQRKTRFPAKVSKRPKNMKAGMEKNQKSLKAWSTSPALVPQAALALVVRINSFLSSSREPSHS